jgi:hypothetical protein
MVNLALLGTGEGLSLVSSLLFLVFGLLLAFYLAPRQVHAESNFNGLTEKIWAGRLLRLRLLSLRVAGLSVALVGLVSAIRSVL